MALRVTIHSPNGGSWDIVLDEPVVRLGRASFCQVRLPYPVVSSHHLTIRQRDGSWNLVDEGSTNGTLIEGRRLNPGEGVSIHDGMTAEIVDVVVEFGLLRGPGEGFTLAESGTMLRQMIQASASAEDDLAFFEVLEGPGRGRRFPIDEHAPNAVLGPGPDCALRFGELDGDLLQVGRDGEGFRVRPVGGVELRVDGERVDEEGRRLQSADRVAAGPVVLLFVDPLEAYLQQMDSEPETGGERSATVADPAEEGPAEEGGELQGLTGLEWVLLVASLVVIAAGVGVMLVILDVV